MENKRKKIKNNQNYCNKNQESKSKVNLSYNIELERKDNNDSNDILKKEYDFIPRFNHLVSLDEQKIKVDEIEKKTK